jgi:hypothetical protein
MVSVTDLYGSILGFLDRKNAQYNKHKLIPCSITIKDHLRKVST